MTTIAPIGDARWPHSSITAPPPVSFSVSTYREPVTFTPTASSLRERARRIGPHGLDYISAAELNAIADLLDKETP